MTTVRGSIRNLAGWVALLAAPAALSAGATQPSDHWAMVDEYCVGCHNTTDWAGKIAFDTMLPEDAVVESKAAQALAWELKAR